MGVHHPSRSFPRFLPEVAVDAEVMEDGRKLMADGRWMMDDG